MEPNLFREFCEVTRQAAVVSELIVAAVHGNAGSLADKLVIGGRESDEGVEGNDAS